MINKDNTINLPQVVSINISEGGIPKWPESSAYITFVGLQGDKHNHAKHNRSEQAISLQDIERIVELRHEGYQLHCGTIGENISVVALDVNSLSIGTVLNFSGGVELEITKVRHPCYVLDTIDPRLKESIKGRCGMYARVLREGILSVGEVVQVKKPMIGQLLEV